NQDRPEKARTSNKDQSLKRAAYDDIYASSQGRMYAPPSPQYQAPPSYGPPSQAAPPQMAPPQQQAPNYQILTLPQAAPPQAAPLQAFPVTVNVPQQALILQQAPQQAAPLNLLSVAAAPTQPVAMAAPTQAAPTQAYVMAAPTQVAAAPTQMVMAAPTQMVAAAPGAGVGISLPGLNLAGANLSLRPPGVAGRFIGRIGKKLRTMSYPRVAIDIEAAEAAAEAGEIEYVVAKQPPKRVVISERPKKHVHEYEEEEEAAPPRRRPPAQYYEYGPQPSPQNSYPPLPSVQRP
ncbi:MAG: hypothetical protein WBX00_12610, partial [Isosphaeraceae bacterium]